MSEFEESGLAHLKNYLPGTARAKISQKEIEWQSGVDLFEASTDIIRLGITGRTASGKTFHALSALEHRVETKASDDQYISRFFAHNKELRDEILKMPLEERWAILREATLMVFIDFDNRGLAPLIAGYTCNPELYECIKYKGVADWESGIAAIQQAYGLLMEHQNNGWGKMGCWLVIDNVQEVWEEVQSDYSKQAYGGLSHIEIRAAAQQKHPGKDRNALAAQGEELGGAFAWSIIKGQLKEVFKPFLNVGWNIMMTAPPKFRKEKYKNPHSNEVIEFETDSIGGAKEMIHWLDWVIHLYTAPDGTQRFARFDKCRWAGLNPNEIFNPTFGLEELEMQRLFAQHLENQRRKYYKKQYAESLPDLSKFGIKKTRNRQKKVKIDPPKNIELPTNTAITTTPDILATTLPPGPKTEIEKTLPKKDWAQNKKLPMPPKLTLPSEPKIEVQQVEETKETEETEKTEQGDYLSPEAKNFIGDQDLQIFIISSADRGKGKYHLPGCSRLSKMTVGVFETFNPDERDGCKTCDPPPPSTRCEELQRQFDEYINAKEEEESVENIIEDEGDF